VSAIALASSIRSCSIAEEAQNLQERQFIRSSNTIWKSKLFEDEQIIKITPSNQDVVLQKAKAIYPDEISKQEWPIEAPDYKLYITVPSNSIIEQVEKRVKKKKGYYTILDDSRVPVIIESYYTINGENFFEKSLYVLEFMAIISDTPYKRPTVDIKGLVFVQRLNTSIESKTYLNKLWSNKNT